GTRRGVRRPPRGRGHGYTSRVGRPGPNPADRLPGRGQRVHLSQPPLRARAAAAVRGDAVLLVAECSSIPDGGLTGSLATSATSAVCGTVGAARPPAVAAAGDDHRPQGPATGPR